MKIYKSERPKAFKTKDLRLGADKGFTLIELSIVIVIIGLIVAGIVGGQSLVRQAKLRGIITDYKKISIATTAFLLEYNALPGDISNASFYWSGADDGDGNGYIDSSIERRRAFTHLGLSVLIPQLSGVSPGTEKFYTDTFDNYIQLNVNNNQYQRPRVNIIVYEGDKVFGNPQPGFLKPKEAFSIDTKIDDGDPTDGIFVVTNPVPSNPLVCLTAGWGVPVGGADYILSSVSESCRIMFFCKSLQKNCIP